MATNIDALEARVVVVEHGVAAVKQDVQRLETLILAQLAELKIQIAKLLERQHSDELASAERRAQYAKLACPQPGLCVPLDGKVAALSARLDTAEKRLDDVRLWRSGIVYVLLFVVAAWPIVKEFLK